MYVLLNVMSRSYCEWFFFFQAEDGIRDLVRSRGLGDVYKRQINGRFAGGGYVAADRFSGARFNEYVFLMGEG